MKKLRTFYTLCLICCSINAAVAQQNALDFDGIDDYVQVSNASALIANQTGFSMSCWVYPTNAAPGFPNFDGVMGFRNEMNADFYILQLSNVNWECRLRNSNNTVYTITSPTVQLNTWQHIALVFTGSNLEFYHNGSLASSIAATGSISNAAVDMFIGRIPFQTTPFSLTGKVDDAALWSKALSAAEVACIYQGDINPASNGLAAYYPMNQGVPGGNNSAQFYLDDVLSINYDGFLNGLLLSGSNSNFVSGMALATEISDTLCLGDSLLVNGQLYAAPGNYQIYLSGAEGCDSLVELSLAIDPVNTGISRIDSVFTATDPQAAAYQWINCNGFTPIAGANSRTFTANQNGSYAVIVTNNRGCSDTSNCLTVMHIGVEENSLLNDLSVYPNPSRELVFNYSNEKIITLTIRDLIGKTHYKGSFTKGSHTLNLEHMEAGLYLLYFQVGDKVSTVKWVKN